MDRFSNDVATLIVVIACLLALKFVLNVVRFLRMKRYLRRYKQWHATGDEKFLESKAQVVQLLKDARVRTELVQLLSPLAFPP